MVMRVADGVMNNKKIRNVIIIKNPQPQPGWQEFDDDDERLK